jgi:Pyruvate/2-oxoacid:ferredoxin oxidoreductase delta subunit
VIVLGATAEAQSVALALARAGYRVEWISEGVVSEKDVPGLTLHALATLVGLSGQVGSFVARVQGSAGVESIPAAALVVATGNERYYPQERYGLALSSVTLSVPQVLAQLAAPRPTGAALPHRRERLLVMLDLGGETAKETAAEALRLALRLRQEWHSEVNVFYQNLKVDTYNLDLLTRVLREAGIVFCRYEAPKVTVDDDGVSVAYVEGALRGELLILPEAIRPRADTASLARLLQVRCGADGYFQDVNIHQLRPGNSNRRGIFYAGRCHLDGDLADLVTDAQQAVANVAALLERGYLEPDEVIAEVEADKCIRCLTCVRTCPHTAVAIATVGGVTAARVAELACQGCGACVANCPVRAITLVGTALPEWATAEA